MKKMKRLAALFLAVVMVLAMGMTAMAAGNITIDNPQDGAEYKAYKIFSVTKSGDNYSYKLDDSSDAYGLKDVTSETQTANGFSLTVTTVEGVYNAKVTDAPKFAAYLRTFSFEETAGVPGTPTNGKVVFDLSGKDEGYYFVNTTTGTLANLNTVEGSNLTIYDKNETPKIEKKTVDLLPNNNVELGQSVPYEIKGKVPSVVGYRVYNYNVSDKMGEGLTYDAASLRVTVGTTVIYENSANTADAPASGFTVTQNTDGFKLELNLVKDNGESAATRYEALYEVGTDIIVEYNATVNDKAVVVENVDATKNAAKLEFSNNPSDTTSTDTYEPTPVILNTGNIVINKYVGNINDENDKTGAKLAGAKFVLKNEDGQYYKVVDGVVTWVAENGDVVESNVEATAKFTGLTDGTYYLVETEAPAGYNLMEKETPVEVTHKDTTKVIVEPVGDVANYTGAVLPSTGGIGTTIFYVVGGILVLGAGVLLITKKRMSGRS